MATRQELEHLDDSYFNALVHVFEQALTIIAQLASVDGDALIARLDKVRAISHNVAYGVGDDMDFLLAKHGRQ